MTSTDDLARDLVAAHPAVRAIHQEHLTEYGELLPHVLLGDITRWLAGHGPDVPVLEALERHLASGDDDTQNVVAVSFLENLEPDDVAVRAALGPRLRSELHTMESWTPDARDQPG